jgi:hypothetical protein
MGVVPLLVITRSPINQESDQPNSSLQDALPLPEEELLLDELEELELLLDELEELELLLDDEELLDDELELLLEVELLALELLDELLEEELELELLEDDEPPPEPIQAGAIKLPSCVP